MASLGLKDKIGQELFAGDKVQIVNGATSGTVIYKIQAAGKPYTVVGNLNEKDGKMGTLEVAAKKVRKIK